jgi:hypothetical protein
VVPVAAEVGRLGRDGDEVADPRLDVVVAAGAEVGLDRLVGLDAADLDVPVDPDHPRNPHSTSATTTTMAAATIT